MELLDLWTAAIDAYFDLSKNQVTDREELAIALALPFVGRFSCSVPGDISTHTKLGGMCVYHGWENDFSAYLRALHRRLEIIAGHTASLDHTIIYADVRTAALPKDRFGGMLTSPPYPNHRDFATMFRPERAFLDWLDEEHGMPPNGTTRSTHERAMGSHQTAASRTAAPDRRARPPLAGCA